jgi:hypothetical protein
MCRAGRAAGLIVDYAHPMVGETGPLDPNDSDRLLAYVTIGEAPNHRVLTD